MNAATKLPGDVGAIHFVGIGGIGMSGIAERCRQLGGEFSESVQQGVTLTIRLPLEA